MSTVLLCPVSRWGLAAAHNQIKTQHCCAHHYNLSCAAKQKTGHYKPSQRLQRLINGELSVHLPRPRRDGSCRVLSALAGCNGSGKCHTWAKTHPRQIFNSDWFFSKDFSLDKSISVKMPVCRQNLNRKLC